MLYVLLYCTVQYYFELRLLSFFKVQCSLYSSLLLRLCELNGSFISLATCTTVLENQQTSREV